MCQTNYNGNTETHFSIESVPYQLRKIYLFQIEFLFIAGFFSSLVFGTVVGSFADKL